jgi:hypothetical protein
MSRIASAPSMQPQTGFHYVNANHRKPCRDLKFSSGASDTPGVCSPSQGGVKKANPINK